MSELVKKIVNELLDDTSFVNACAIHLNSIFEDKKFTSSDLPDVLNLVLLVVQEKDNLDVDENDFIEVFRLLIVELLKKLKIIENTNDELDKMIESCLKLLKTKVKTSNFLSKFNKLLKKLFSCKCKCKC